MKNNNRILLLIHKNAKHDFFAEFNDNLINGLSGRGIDTDIADFSEPHEKWTAYVTSILKHEYDAVIVLNSWGEHNITLDNGSNIFDRADTPIYNWIVDHPAEHNGHLETNCMNYHVICIDRDHVRFLKKYYPNVASASFLPLPVRNNNNTGNRLDDFINRKKDIVFAGNCPDIKRIEAVFDAQPEAQRELLYYLADYLMSHKRKSYETALEAVLEAVFDREPTTEEFREYVRLTTPVIPYVRALAREEIIRDVMDSEIKLHLYGEGWDKYHRELKNGNTILEGIAGFKQLPNIYNDSKMVLNIMPWFRDGMHDRILTGLFSGAAVLTDHTGYLDEIEAAQKDKQSILFFDIEKTGDLPKIIERALSNIKELYETAANGSKLAQERFGCDSIIDGLIEIIRDTSSNDDFGRL